MAREQVVPKVPLSRAAIGEAAVVEKVIDDLPIQCALVTTLHPGPLTPSVARSHLSWR